jgi:hypothetical protein
VPNKLDSDIPWLEPWERTDEETAALLEAELRRELPSGHILSTEPVAAIARRVDCDDVAFRLTNRLDAVAIVHLTYQAERDPEWPATKIIEGPARLSQLIENDHIAYTRPA